MIQKVLLQWPIKRAKDGLEVNQLAGKSRVPMQVSPEFEMRIKKLQSLIMKSQGKNVSLRDLTEKVCKDPTFDDLEKSILKVTDFDLKINFDRRNKK
jgi:hypothetical protein